MRTLASPIPALGEHNPGLHQVDTPESVHIHGPAMGSRNIVDDPERAETPISRAKQRSEDSQHVS